MGAGGADECFAIVSCWMLQIMTTFHQHYERPFNKSTSSAPVNHSHQYIVPYSLFFAGIYESVEIYICTAFKWVLRWMQSIVAEEMHMTEVWIEVLRWNLVDISRVVYQLSKYCSHVDWSIVYQCHHFFHSCTNLGVIQILRKKQDCGLNSGDMNPKSAKNLAAPRDFFATAK